MIRLHAVTQGSDAWFAARCGLICASEVKLILTPTLKIADNEKERAHLFELLAQRITKFVEPSFKSDDMLKGYEGEIIARDLYHRNFAPVDTHAGFVTNDRWGFTLGYSPDGFVGADGQIEIKTRRQKFQVQTIIEDLRDGTIPAEHVLQVQAGLLVSERAWCDFVSYSPGLPLTVVRIEPNERVQEAIVDAATSFEDRLQLRLRDYRLALRSDGVRTLETERIELGDIAA